MKIAAILTGVALDSAERLTALNLQTARSLSLAWVANSSALFGAKDIQTVLSLRTALAQLILEKSVFHCHHAYEIASRSNEVMAKLLDPDSADLSPI